MTKLVQNFTAKIRLWIIFRKLVYRKQTILLQLFPPFRLLQNDYFYQSFAQNFMKKLFFDKKNKNNKTGPKLYHIDKILDH